ncbi:endonuclease I [Methylohalomonas lacus]|uniref:Endonuclease I n=1 Tax=Methylohalomonas lacus TaxID=398773 RepID=A0AAE3HHY4_9GAMM|nr:endonuclease [Methylohalomonas lacus]MCS3902195.1 endonuclease I [Methylohalomonas lacus]
MRDVAFKSIRILIGVVLLGLFAGGLQADPPSGYYEDARGKSGAALREALHAIIRDHEVLPYTRSGNDDWLDGEDRDVWEALLYTDSACPDYRPECGLVQLLYLDDFRHLDMAYRGGRGPDKWSREHIWPKSRGFPRQSQDGYTDLHHLRPADRSLNGAHRNYGYDDGGERVMDRLSDGSEVATTARLDRDRASFEPPDRAKGQVARMLFYMAVRYEGDGDMPDLELVNRTELTDEPRIGRLCTLLDWHNQYGPTDFERRRNDRVHAIQGNRNPFIDEPGWANLIWGQRCEA